MSAKDNPAVLHDVSRFTDFDVYLFKQGTHFKLYDKMGAHIMTVDGRRGTCFAVWAPNAERVSVIGDFNGWTPRSHPLRHREDNSGIWEGFIPGVEHGMPFKYHIESHRRNYRTDRGDPFGFRWEIPPATSTMVWDLGYDWEDAEWMANRRVHNRLDAPWSIYEIHIGSWRRVPEDENRSLNYREMAQWLVPHLLQTGFTHVEFLPVMEHPFYGSWGYQVTGYFAVSSRFGSPQDFMYLVDQLHQNGIGVILDWVPSHFPTDEHGLVYFDGTHLYEHEDPRKGFHPEWKSNIFNYGRNEVRNFLGSSGLFWLDKFHIDGLRVDAVASMLYLDYAREGSDWIPNPYGGRENVEAIQFLKDFNQAVYREHPDVQTIAEESTAWPMVSKPVYVGGLGFGMKWNMGWMHDTLDYFSKNAIFRKYHHNQLTFSIWYAFYENFVLPLSHDEVVHGKGSLFGKMSGIDEWQRYANLRILYGYMYGHPGKKLLFMGAEMAQWKEWAHEESLEWNVLEDRFHGGTMRWLSDLNHLYRREPSLHEVDFGMDGFEWIDCHDWEHSIICFIRKSRDASRMMLVVCNMTPVPRENYLVGVPRGGLWLEVLNSDADLYGGSGMGNKGQVMALESSCHGRPHSLSLTLPPLSVIFLKNG